VLEENLGEEACRMVRECEHASIFEDALRMCLKWNWFSFIVGRRYSDFALRWCFSVALER
jgi:hypothetical protein